MSRNHTTILVLDEERRHNESDLQALNRLMAERSGILEVLVSRPIYLPSRGVLDGEGRLIIGSTNRPDSI